MRSSNLALNILIALTVSVFILSILYTHNFGSNSFGVSIRLQEPGAGRSEQSATTSKPSKNPHNQQHRPVQTPTHSSPLTSHSFQKKYHGDKSLEEIVNAAHHNKKHHRVPPDHDVSTTKSNQQHSSSITSHSFKSPDAIEKLKPNIRFGEKPEQKEQHVFKPPESPRHDFVEYYRNPADRELDDSKLTCKASFEDKCEIYPYVKFWNKQFHPNDCYESPLRPKQKENTPIEEQKYVVFEPDRGGWNNIRMAAEVAIIFAHATGRTLVLPPAARWYLLNKDNNQTENVSTFSKFFDLQKLAESMTMITMEDFLNKVARIPGFLKTQLKPDEPIATYFQGNMQKLWDFLDASCYTEQWEPGKQFIGFNISLKNSNLFGTFDTDAERNLRYRIMVAHGRKLRPYDEALHNEKAIYFPGDYRNSHRILTHFYTYLYWEDPHIARIYARIVRDRLHYHNSIFCAAGSLVKAIHMDASKLTGKPVQSSDKGDKKTLGGNTNEDATYFAMHVRRGDFQYDQVKLGAKHIVKNSFHLFDPNVTRLLYIATDEQNRAFFQPFMEGPFEVRFLSDYYDENKIKSIAPNINANHIGMIEQVICANAHTFVGTPFSTFTGYITRMRGE